MNRAAHVLKTCFCAGLLLAAAACSSVETADSSKASDPVLVSAADLASNLRLVRHPMDANGKIVLTSSAGESILIFPETTVVSIRGAQFSTAEPIQLISGEAWLTKGDASALETLWSSPVARRPEYRIPAMTALPPLPPMPSPSPSGGVAPRPTGLYSDQPTAAESRSWSVPLRRPWHYIVIHHSASDAGNAAVFNSWHLKKGWDGLGYDFVIGNGNGCGDGTVEVGFRWTEQKRGAHAGNDLMNEQGVGICLVGDFTKTRPTSAQMKALSRLCNFLSSYCGIPRENFRTHGDVRQTTCPGPLFPRDFLASPQATRVVAGAGDQPGALAQDHATR
jgi:hypothetical protein